MEVEAEVFGRAFGVLVVIVGRGIRVVMMLFGVVLLVVLASLRTVVALVASLAEVCALLLMMDESGLGLLDVNMCATVFFEALDTSKFALAAAAIQNKSSSGNIHGVLLKILSLIFLFFVLFLLRG